MKRRLIICSSLITIILSCFSFPIFAEETVQDSSNLHTIADGVLLDSYFYDNYDLLPYIQSNSGNQYIDTGIMGSSDIDITLKFSDFEMIGTGNAHYLFGTYANDTAYGAYIRYETNDWVIYIANSSQSSSYSLNPYQIYDVSINGNSGYINDELVINRSSNYQMASSIGLFSRHIGNDYSNNGHFKLYSCKIFDHSLNNGEGGYVRYYYPAKSKASGTIGLYDAVSKTFATTGSVAQFTSPTNEYVENFQISSFLTASLTWIGQILTAIIDMPIIIIFMAIGLAGAMFRWGRRIVHF